MLVNHYKINYQFQKLKNQSENNDALISMVVVYTKENIQWITLGEQ